MMTIAVVSVTALMVLATRRAALVPGRWQSVAEMSYEFVADMIDTNIGHGGRQFFPFIFTLFMFILFANLLGMIPYSYTTTSQIIVTFALAAVVFILVTTIGIIRHGFHFLSLFVPHGVPKVLLLLLVPIELLSYCIRPFTLSIRLFANMLAGHTMLAIFGGFAASIGVFAFFPTGIDIAARRSRISRRGIAGLCLCHPDLPLPARGDSSALNRLAQTFSTTENHNGSRFRQNDRGRSGLHCPRGRRCRHRQCVLGADQLGRPQSRLRKGRCSPSRFSALRSPKRPASSVSRSPS